MQGVNGRPLPHPEKGRRGGGIAKLCTPHVYVKYLEKATK
jgi:hypothetical protein